ncbi:MAG: ABC transporter ATP-binding protein [Nitrospirae bacterium]|nr:ABC transporter ATP-binding protein [Nitrospirota bacterium]
MFKLENISKQYKGQQVLKAANLEIGEKEMISIMGRSGAGKSTLLGIMAGLIKPDSGRALFKGEDLTHLDEETLAGFRLKHIGIVFQDFKLIPSLSVYDNILLGIYPRRDLSKSDKAGRIHGLAKRVGLEHKLKEKADNLSGGEKQRVAIARSLVNQPGIVLADEPTGNLDAATSDSIMSLFRELHQTLQTSFIIVTHDREIAQKTERTYIMQEGELI